MSSPGSPSLNVAFILPHNPPSKRRKCRPGYKSPAKLARSKAKAIYFNLAETLKQENESFKLENLNLKVELTKIKLSCETLKNAHKEALLSQETLYIHRQNEILSKLKDNFKLTLYDKEEALKSANTKINLLEENKIDIEDKLNSYRDTLRKLIKDKERKKVHNKGK